jgi:hypothetical protein
MGARCRRASGRTPPPAGEWRCPEMNMRARTDERRAARTRPEAMAYNLKLRSRDGLFLT